MGQPHSGLPILGILALALAPFFLPFALILSAPGLPSQTPAPVSGPQRPLDPGSLHPPRLLASSPSSLKHRDRTRSFLPRLVSSCCISPLLVGQGQTDLREVFEVREVLFVGPAVRRLRGGCFVCASGVLAVDVAAVLRHECWVSAVVCHTSSRSDTRLGHTTCGLLDRRCATRRTSPGTRAPRATPGECERSGGCTVLRVN